MVDFLPVKNISDYQLPLIKSREHTYFKTLVTLAIMYYPPSLGDKILENEGLTERQCMFMLYLGDQSVIKYNRVEKEMDTNHGYGQLAGAILHHISMGYNSGRTNLLSIAKQRANKDFKQVNNR